jgi:uncharacterized membrane protein
MRVWIQRAAIGVLILFAAYVRLDGLDEPLSWYDEAIASLRVAGHTEKEVAEFASAHPKSTLGELRQFVTADAAGSSFATLRSLTSEDAQHTPLYYFLARWWALLFGSKLVAARTLPACMSLLAMAAMYWVCLELFVKTGAFPWHGVCWLGVLAFACSPYQIAFAREHREYSMWALTTLLCCGAFLRAVRKDTWKAWGLYALVLTISLYTQMLSGALALVFGVFLLVKQRLRPRGAFARLVAASASAGLLFLPWVFVLQSRRGAVESSLGWVTSFSRGRFRWASARSAFRVADLAMLDVLGLWQGLPGRSVVLLIQWLVPLALLAGMLRLAKDSRRDAAWFSAAMALSISLPLFLLDFLTGSTSGFALRYAVPSAIGWLFVLVFMAASLVGEAWKWRLAGCSAGAAYVMVAAISAVSTHDARITAAKGMFYRVESIDFLNSTDRITLVSDEFVGDMLTLAQNVRSDLPVVWAPRCFTCARGLSPFAEIPAEAPRTGQVVYFRSWVNIWPGATRRKLAIDQFDDPRFHTKSVLLSGPSGDLFASGDLFWLTPREGASH